jgi:hypothetical protein
VSAERDAALVDAGIASGLKFASEFLAGAAAGADFANMRGYAQLLRGAAGELATVTPARVREVQR